MTGGVLGEGEGEYEDALAFDSVGDHPAVPEALVELVVDGLGVAAVGVEQLMGEGGLGDLLEVFGAVESAFGVAGFPEAGFGVSLGPVVFGCRDAYGDAVFVGSVMAVDVQQVVPGAFFFSFAVLEPEDVDREQFAGAVVEEGAFGNAALVAPQVVPAARVGESLDVHGLC